MYYIISYFIFQKIIQSSLFVTEVKPIDLRNIRKQIKNFWIRQLNYEKLYFNNNMTFFLLIHNKGHSWGNFQTGFSWHFRINPFKFPIYILDQVTTFNGKKSMSQPKKNHTVKFKGDFQKISWNTFNVWEKYITKLQHNSIT